MRILYLAHRIPYPPNKGEKIRAYHQVRYLAERHQLDLVCLIDDQRDLQHVASLEEICNRVYALQIKPFQAKARGLFSQLAGGTVSVGYYHRPAVQKIIDQWLAETAYDAIVCFSSTMAEYVFRSRSMGRASQTRLIMDLCDVDSDKWRQYAEKARFPLNLIFDREHRRMQSYEQRIHDAFDCSILVSGDEAELFSAQIGTRDKVAVIQNGIDAYFFDRRNGFDNNVTHEGGNPVLVFTGAMDYHVNIEGVVWFCSDVLPLIRQKHPQVQFKIVGSNPTATVKQLAHDEGIEVTGFVDDIRPYYAMADVCVAPLRLGRGIQNKVLEAMAMERAVVTTSRANAGIQAGKDHLVIADSPADFADAVDKLISNDDLREQLGGEARRFVVDHFDWEKNLASFVSLLSHGMQENLMATNHSSTSRGHYGE